MGVQGFLGLLERRGGGGDLVDLIGRSNTSINIFLLKGVLALIGSLENVNLPVLFSVLPCCLFLTRMWSGFGRRSRG